MVSPNTPMQPATGTPWPAQTPYPCARCGAAGADYFPAGAPPMHRACAGLEPDVLAWPWLLLAYSVAVPFGCTFVGALVASIPYYLWRGKYPLRAKRYNRHVWIAFGISCLLYGGLFLVSALSTKK